ncbi:MAG: oligosaccharide flippase family protein [Trueperaceae bacterium]
MQRFSTLRQRIFQSRLAQNALALYIVQFARYLLPLVTIPYLARVLGVENWGHVLFTQAFSLWLILILEYGFNLSASRDIANFQGSPSAISKIVANVMGAKGLLLVLSVIITLGVNQFVPSFREFPLHLWLAWLSASATGFMPLWYFQGIENMKPPAFLDLGVRVFTTLLIFIVVRHPNDAWLVLALQALAGCVTTFLACFWMYQKVSFTKITLRESYKALQKGFSMFLFQAAVSLYTTANAFLLGLLATPSSVTFYSNADRLVKTSQMVNQPLYQVFYPRINSLLAPEPLHALRLVKFSLLLMSSIGLCIGLSIFALSPFIVSHLLGPGYEPTIELLRILSLLPFLVAVSNVLGIQWMLPHHLDRSFNTIVIVAGLVNLGAALLIAPRFGAVGIAWLVIVIEAFITLSMFIVLWRRGLNPFIYRGLNKLQT